MIKKQREILQGSKKEMTNEIGNKSRVCCLEYKKKKELSSFKNKCS